MLREDMLQMKTWHRAKLFDNIAIKTTHYG